LENRARFLMSGWPCSFRQALPAKQSRPQSPDHSLGLHHEFTGAEARLCRSVYVCMGIKGLLQSLRGHERRCHLSGFRGKCLAADALVW
jgi:hypothetical protein